MAKDLKELLGEEKVLLDDQEVDLNEIIRWRDTRKNIESDYTKKTQELSATMAKLREDGEKLQPWFELQEYMQQHPDKAKLISEIVDGKVDVGETSKTTGAPDEKFAQIERKIEGLSESISKEQRKTQEEREIRETQQAVNDQLTLLKTKFPDINSREVLFELSLDPNLESMNMTQVNIRLEELANKVHLGRLEYEKSIIDRYLKDKTNLNKQNETQGTGGQTGAVNQDKVLKFGEETMDETERVIKQFQKENQ